MSTEAIAALTSQTIQANRYTSSSSSTTNKNSELDMSDFLQLIAVQMSCQDPLSSGSSDSGGINYISQLAQMTILEQLSSLSDGLATSQAYSMIGKYVYLGESEESGLTFGRVDGVVNEDGSNYLMVNGDTYSLSDVYAVADAGSTSADEELLNSAGLIGKTVTATVTDDAGAESTVSGQVEKVLVRDGIIYLVVGEREIALGDIGEISGTAQETETV